MSFWAKSAESINGWHFSNFISVIEPYAIIIAIFAFAIELGDRAEERSARAWQLVTTAAQGNSGKIQALQFLNQQDYLFWPDFIISPPPIGLDRWWPEEPSWWPLSKQRMVLFEIDLRPNRKQQPATSAASCGTTTYLIQVQLPNAQLRRAKMNCGNISLANFVRADLLEADFSSALLGFANLSAARLKKADFSGAFLISANFEEANLKEADLSGAILLLAKLEKADLSAANLSGANLSRAILRGTNLSSAKLTDAKNLTQEQLDLACVSRDGRPPTLPEGLTPPQNICEE